MLPFLLIFVWSTISPLSKEQYCAAMESAFRSDAGRIRFCALCIPHSTVTLVLALGFYTKDPYRVRCALNIFLFLNISRSAGSEAALLT